MKTLDMEARGINLEALTQLVDKHKKINQLIRDGKNIDPELTKNFVTFPIHDNPYKR